MKLHIDVLTLFPELFPGPLAGSITGRAMNRGLLEIDPVNLRDFSHDERGTVDDKPYGGGPGMLMKVEPLFEATDFLKTRSPGAKVVLTTPRGRLFSQKLARELAKEERLIVVCGHYEGVDQRYIDSRVDYEVSIGDYVLTNGNLPAMVMIDAIARLLPGALGCDESSEDESHTGWLLEYPQYTRPEEYEGLKVPEILLSGDHGKIAAWRRLEAERLTMRRRPELYARHRAWPSGTEDINKD